MDRSDARQQPKKMAAKSSSEEASMLTAQGLFPAEGEDRSQDAVSTEVKETANEDDDEDDDDEIMWDEDGEEEEENQDDVLERMGFLIPSKQAERTAIEGERNSKKGKRRRTRSEMIRARNEHKLHLLVLLSRCIQLNEQCEDEILKNSAKAAVPSRFKLSSSITSTKRETKKEVEKQNEFTENEKKDKSEVTFVGINSSSLMDFSKLRLFVSWFRNRFFVNTNTDLSTPNSMIINCNSGSSSLASVIETTQGTETQLVQVFVTMLRTLHLPCRIVFALKPRTRSSSTKKLKKPKLKTIRGNTDVKETDGFVLLDQYNMHQPMIWAEVWMKVSDDEHIETTDDDVTIISNPNSPHSVRGSWVHVDVLNNKVNDPQSYRTWTQGKGFTRTTKVSDEAPYIVGLSDGNYVMDVTRRYVSRYSQMVCHRVKTNSKKKPTHFGEEERLKLLARLELEKMNMPNVPLPPIEHWWEGIILGGLRQKAAETLFLRESNYDMKLDKYCPEANYLQTVRETTSSEAFMNEYDQLCIGVLNEDMPTSDQGFRKHPEFALDSHLKYNQGIAPHVKSVGIFKDHKVYDRIYIEELHTVTKWKQKARIVKSEEIEHPVKIRKIAAKGRGMGQQESKTETDNVEISNSVENSNGNLDVDDNEVYTNGNFETTEGKTMISYYGEWQTEKFVPPIVVNDEIPKNKYGNVELFCPEMCPVGAVHLRFPCVDQAARKLGVSFARAVVGWEKQYPKFDGIVVSINFEASVRDAAQEIHARSIEKEKDKRLKRIAARWEILVKHLLARERVQQKYGKR